MATLLLGLLFAAYVAWALARLGVHQRLPLALGPISLDTIPDRAARRYGERVLFTTDQRCPWAVPALREQYPDGSAWSAARILRTADHVATLLRERCAVAHGDRVAILKTNHLDMHVLMLAVIRAGGIACPINDRFGADAADGYLLHVGARLLISDRATVTQIMTRGGTLAGVEQLILAESEVAVPAGERSRLSTLLTGAQPSPRLLWLEEALAEVDRPLPPVRRDPDETLYLVHTSGTTGFPKAVELRNGAQSHAVRGWLCYVHVSRSRDRGYLAVPNNHQAVILTFNSLLLLGLPVHWTRHYHRDGFHAERVVAELATGGFTGFFGFPVVYTQLKEARLDARALRRMRFWASTADASHEVVMRRLVSVGGAFRGLGLPLHGSVFLDAQGSSEVGTPSVLRYVTRFTRRFGRRIGRPGTTPFGPRVRVVDEAGTRVPRGDVGRLEVKGRTVFPGYWRQPGLTDQVFRDGWFFTGDVVRRGRDGYLIQLDREVDVIRTRQGPVHSLPMEEALHRHPDVHDVCVYGAQEPDGSQRPAVAVALRAGVSRTAAELRPELDALLPPQTRLHHVDVLAWEDFPMGVTGKTLKRVFRERSAAAGSPSEPTAVPAGPL